MGFFSSDQKTTKTTNLDETNLAASGEGAGFSEVSAVASRFDLSRTDVDTDLSYDYDLDSSSESAIEESLIAGGDITQITTDQGAIAGAVDISEGAFRAAERSLDTVDVSIYETADLVDSTTARSFDAMNAALAESYKFGGKSIDFVEEIIDGVFTSQDSFTERALTGTKSESAQTLEGVTKLLGIIAIAAGVVFAVTALRGR